MSFLGLLASTDEEVISSSGVYDRVDDDDATDVCS